MTEAKSGCHNIVPPALSTRRRRAPVAYPRFHIWIILPTARVHQSPQRFARPRSSCSVQYTCPAKTLPQLLFFDIARLLNLTTMEVREVVTHDCKQTPKARLRWLPGGAQTMDGVEDFSTDRFSIRRINI